eukprot:GHVS01030997.1.p1 GENE.GHVS01030997.1~~GHVS01030997.1.p1  ORF type:complete len:361 (-),score=34.53 GHVS01030997.1:172-1254(-)
MGCLNADKNDSHHYLSGAVGVWGQGLALQIGAGGILFFTGYNWGGLKELTGLTSGLSISAGWKVMEVLGILHIVFAAVAAVFVLLTVFVSSCFNCLLHFINAVNSMFCIGSAIVCGLYLNRGYHIADNLFENLWNPNDPKPVNPDFPVYQMYALAKGRIMLGAVFSLAALAPFSRAPTIKLSDPTPEVILYVNALIVCLCLGASLILPTDIWRTLIFGSVWVGITGVVAILQAVFSCFSRVTSVFLVGIVFLCISVFSLITVGYLGNYYATGRDITLGVSMPDVGGLGPYALDFGKVAIMPPSDRDYFLMFHFTDEGSFLLAGITLALSQFILSLFFGIYSLRFSFGKRRESRQSLSKEF